jgi:hypothetical protein
MDIRILDVAAIFPEVGRNTVGAGLLAEGRRGDRIRIGAPPGLPDGGHVVDVDVETLVAKRHARGSRG